MEMETTTKLYATVRMRWLCSMVALGTVAASTVLELERQHLAGGPPCQGCHFAQRHVNASDNTPLSSDEVAYRFDALKRAGVREVDIWSMPIPTNFWPFIEAFAAGEV